MVRARVGYKKIKIEQEKRDIQCDAQWQDVWQQGRPQRDVINIHCNIMGTTS